MTTNIEIPDKLDRAVEQAFEESGYSSKSEFVRDSVRRRLEEMYGEDWWQEV